APFRCLFPLSFGRPTNVSSQNAADVVWSIPLTRFGRQRDDLAAQIVPGAARWPFRRWARWLRQADLVVAKLVIGPTSDAKCGANERGAVGRQPKPLC